MSQVDALFDRYGTRYRLWVTLTVMLGLVALGMSITIVNVAIPYIKGAFGMSDSQVQWLSTGFLASTTVSLLIAPWLVTSVGQRATFMGLLLVFIAASFLGGLGQSMGMLIAARVIQGGMTGLIRPVAMEALFAAYPPQNRGMATAMYGMCLGLPLTLATVIGGWLVEHFTWRYVFFITLPICVAAAVMGFFFLPPREHKGPRPPFDWAGVVLLFTAVFTVLAALSNGQRWGWDDPRVPLLLLTGLLCGAAFVAWQQRTAHPLLDLAIFRNRLFVTGTLAMFLFGGTFYGIMYLLPQFVQSILHYSPISAGQIFLPSTAVLAVLVPMVGRLSDRFPPHWITLPGLACTLVAVWLMTHMDWNTSFAYLAVAMAVLSIGMAAFPPPTLSNAIAALPPRLTGHGSGAINFAMQLGGAMGTAALVILLDRRTAVHGQHLNAGVHAGNSQAQQQLGQLAELAGRLGVAETQQGAIAGHLMGRLEAIWASILAYQDGFWILVASLVVVAIPSLLLSRLNRSAPAH
ncbi:DHA2 family efflux MFS transporter permease subunit [Alloalcanivorax gelatiniphagus]|uniref:DHA2 family efflux MFS transporter permease subunit n=1 Tax=Alloalcanivorax gelatiniphagus TaxID=1194167 RepID=A0ABY2XIY1_9GAMM|nr:DHA2 family efflux MFS transporter permease subunit [Alloalcanivorax gelatiniphagus]TMW11853.1 DHA2 family efflux MFS transporter permease subunit [Alloalcanivorax gelatiniphagus]|tara:strand:+ start:1314 stop:2870 length:1557 start_codon:yes stop_codon:yes gene_type:complete